jgi:glycine/D-amino acid oxidase-like deaminating enzyme
MDLHSGIPFWLVKNGLLADYPALEKDLLKEEVVIIGSGIAGALAAHELCSAGFHCTMVDKRLLSSGSTWASTAILNYELDFSLSQLSRMYDEEFALGVYQASLASVHRMQAIAKETHLLDCIEIKSSLYLASDERGTREIEEEYQIRSRHDFPVELLEENQLSGIYGIKRKNALFHHHALQLDPYRITVGLIQYHMQRGSLKVYTRTTIKKLQSHSGGVTLLTDKGHTIQARHVVCAPGFESRQFLPQQVMALNSTYALVTQPLPGPGFWKDRSMIWESARPYFYLRTTADNRIMMGGEDLPFQNETARDRLLHKKAKLLLQKFKELFPHIVVQADFCWCGTFGETSDGLPYIGAYPGMDHVYFALGYGGNGTSFSITGAQIICQQLKGVPDERSRLFSFERGKSKVK